MTPNKFGLLDRDLNYIIQSMIKFPEIEKATIFGSRAMGNYKKGSDIDLSIAGKNINYKTVSRLSNILNQELPIPYFIDVVNYNTINNLELKEHIDTEGVVFYSTKKHGDNVEE